MNVSKAVLTVSCLILLFALNAKAANPTISWWAQSDPIFGCGRGGEDLTNSSRYENFKTSAIERLNSSAAARCLSPVRLIGEVSFTGTCSESNYFGGQGKITASGKFECLREESSSRGASSNLSSRAVNLSAQTSKENCAYNGNPFSGNEDYQSCPAQTTEKCHRIGSFGGGACYCCQ